MAPREDVEAGEDSPLLQQTGSKSHKDYTLTSPEPSPEPESYPRTWVDSYLPLVRKRPFTYQLGSNVSAGLTVALINIPLSLALAVASSATPQAGMLTAIWGGLAAAVFGGSMFNVQGPTGALSGMLARYALMFGPSCLPLLSLSSGILMLVAFALRWDRFVTFLPSSVAHGFTLGVAFVIAGGQLGSAFNLPPIPASSEFLRNTAAYISEMPGAADWRVFLVFALSWATLFALVKRWPRIPWMVPVAGVGAFIGYLSFHGAIFRLHLLKDKYGEMDLALFSPDFSAVSTVFASVDTAVEFFVASVSIAFVGVLESLISGRIADGLTKTSMNQRQEVFATAAANLAAGVTGGIPATAALARTALNIKSGATSRLAGICNALFTGLISLFALPLFGYLPLCVVAALLFQVAVGMVETKHLSHAFHLDRGAFFLTLLVAALCLVFDPTTAIVVGAVAGLLRFAESVATGYSEVVLTRDLQTGNKVDLHAFDRHHKATVDEGMVIGAWRKLFGGRPSQDVLIQSTLERQRSSTALLLPSPSPSAASSSSSSSSSDPAPPPPFATHAQDTVIYRIVGDLTYISSLMHCQRLKRLDGGKHLLVSFRYCYYIDLDGLDALEECFRDLARSRPDRLLLLVAIAPQSLAASLLNKAPWIQRDFRDRGHIFATVTEAAAFLRNLPQPLSSANESSSSVGNSVSNSVSSNGINGSRRPESWKLSIDGGIDSQL